jgi:hypothetical protein
MRTLPGDHILLLQKTFQIKVFCRAAWRTDTTIEGTLGLLETSPHHPYGLPRNFLYELRFYYDLGMK